MKVSYNKEKINRNERRSMDLTIFYNNQEDSVQLIGCPQLIFSVFLFIAFSDDENFRHRNLQHRVDRHKEIARELKNLINNHYFTVDQRTLGHLL